MSMPLNITFLSIYGCWMVVDVIGNSSWFLMRVQQSNSFGLKGSVDGMYRHYSREDLVVYLKY